MLSWLICNVKLKWKRSNLDSGPPTSGFFLASPFFTLLVISLVPALLLHQQSLRCEPSTFLFPSNQSLFCLFPIFIRCHNTDLVTLLYIDLYSYTYYIYIYTIILCPNVSQCIFCGPHIFTCVWENNFDFHKEWIGEVKSCSTGNRICHSVSSLIFSPHPHQSQDFSIKDIHQSQDIKLSQRRTRTTGAVVEKASKKGVGGWKRKSLGWLSPCLCWSRLQSRTSNQKTLRIPSLPTCSHPNTLPKVFPHMKHL